MKEIFVSYRRSDSSGVVGRIIDRLVVHFGKERIFRDLDGIEFGQDFGEVIFATLKQVKVVLVVIGDDWVKAADEQGGRRLEIASDWVRLELAAALDAGKHIIPVLVEGAEMPVADQLPLELRPLTSRNAARVRDDPDFNSDMDRLCDAINRNLDANSVRATRVVRRRYYVWAPAFAFAVFLSVAGVVSYFAFYQGVEAVVMPKKLHFLGIGISGYPFSSLRYAHADIEYLREILSRHNADGRLGEFVTLYNSDATRDRIVSEIKRLRGRLERGEVAIVVFAGMEYVADRCYLLPYDAKFSDAGNVKASELESSAIAAEDVFSVMPNAKGDVIFLLDVCHAERFGKELRKINPSVTTLASAGESELAWESESYRRGGGGAFSTAVGAGLEGAADDNGDGYVTLEELSAFVCEETPNIALDRGGQNPVPVGDLFPLVLAARER